MSSQLQRLLPTVAGISSLQGDPRGEDLSRALLQSKLSLPVISGNRIRLAGSTPLPESRDVIERLVQAVAGQSIIDSSGLRVEDEYVRYVVKRGDTPDFIAISYCGSRRYLGAIRAFSRENDAALAGLKPGMVIRIPKRLLRSSGVTPR
jgi:hypothetical protein